MKDEENISEYFDRVDNIVNAIKGLGVDVVENEIVEKILRTLPMLYNPKVSTLEDRENLKNLTMDGLYGILMAYELKLGHENLPKGEVAFKVLKKTKNQKKKSQTSHHEESNVEESNIIKKLQKGSGKYKGVPIPRKTLKMKKIQINNTRRRENSTIRKSTIKEKMFFTQKKRIAVQQSLVTVMKMKSFF